VDEVLELMRELPASDLRVLESLCASRVRMCEYCDAVFKLNMNGFGWKKRFCCVECRRRATHKRRCESGFYQRQKVKTALVQQMARRDAEYGALTAYARRVRNQIF
jgi:hypothetical protein